MADNLKLYHIEVTQTIYVLAEDEAKAHQVARDNQIDLYDGYQYDATEVTAKTRWIDGDWDELEPFVGRSEPLMEKTVEQLWEEMKEAERNKPASRMELEAAGQMVLCGEVSING